MFSLIICSTHTEMDVDLLHNINDTIGTEFEILHIDNSTHAYSIFQAYNIGVEKAKGDLLCFMHEDVIFHTNGWGNKIEHLLNKNPQIGLLGVAGGQMLPSKGDWRMAEEYLCLNYIQGHDTLERNSRYSSIIQHRHCNSNKEGFTEVVVIDGMWFCIPRRLFKNISFDEKLFSGFHLYDVDISIQIFCEGYIAAVAGDCWIEHKSVGNFNHQFLEDLKLLQKKWKDTLPIMLPSLHLSVEQCRSYSNNLERSLLEYIEKQQKERTIREKLSGIGKVRSLSVEESYILENNIYCYLKYCIKRVDMSFRDVVKEIKESIPYISNKVLYKILYKLLFYRLLRH